ncbi:MAG TPA: sulfatase-like hydrolase/transferase [Sphingomicrobium sp.]|nr:sulfatase-like hydrolase/transferase [Sphingomicrobium sp.]
MDRLAGEGLRFRNAFVISSLCSPSRAAFLTGAYKHLKPSTPMLSGPRSRALRRGCGIPTEVRTSACMQASGMMASSEEEPLKGADRLTARLEARLFS